MKRILFSLLLGVGLVNANIAGGGTGSGASVTLTDKGTSVVIQNGLISMTVVKANAQITTLTFNGNDLLGSGSGNGNTFYWSWNPTTLGAEETPANCTYKLVSDPTTNGGAEATISLTRPYSGTNAAWDVTIYYTLRKGSTGFYAAGTFSRPAGYPAYIMGETRFLGKINNGIFDWFTQDSLRNAMMPSIYEQGLSTVVTNAPKEVTQIQNGKDSGEYLCKYTYTGDFGNMKVWGWSSVNDSTGDASPNNFIAGKQIGIWMTRPSMEYYNGGPMKREITWVLLNMLNGEHYGMGNSFGFAQNETWTKVYGPFLVYANQFTGSATATPTQVANALWQDAQAQEQAEELAWPYTWFTDTNYAQASGRSTVTGTLKISDTGAPNASPANMWIGLYPDDSVDFQYQAKTYQFWVKTGADGSFTIPNVLPGKYVLAAFGPGAAGTYRQTAITVTKGVALKLGTVTWTPVRTASTVWEIGIPDRDSREFYNGAFNYAWWQTAFINYPTEFPNGVNYTVGTSDWSKDWNYAQVNNVNNSWSTSPWTISFTLPKAPTAGTNARLYIAFASSYYAHLTITVNGTQIASFAPGNMSDAVVRLGSHGAFYDTSLVFASGSLKQGVNTIVLNQVKSGETSTIEYDYLRLEADGTSLSSSSVSSSSKALSSSAVSSSSAKTSSSSIRASSSSSIAISSSSAATTAVLPNVSLAHYSLLQTPNGFLLQGTNGAEAVNIMDVQGHFIAHLHASPMLTEWRSVQPMQNGIYFVHVTTDSQARTWIVTKMK